MPSAEHESPVALAKLDPDLVAWLLANLFEVKVPSYHHARTQAADVQVLVPRTYHADSMVLFCDSANQPLAAAVLEVQRSRDPAKRRTWKLYVAQLEAELDVSAALVVFCPDPAVARWYRDLLAPDDHSGLPLQPLFLIPDQVPLVAEPDLARANPALAVLSAICHGGHTQLDTTFPALAEALRSVGPDQAIRYYDIVLSGLPEAARTRWEEFMTTAVEEFRSELLRDLVIQNQEVGKAIGEGQAVLTVLETRGVPVPAAARERILACTDLVQLETWLRRAVTANTVDDVLHS